VEEEEAKEKDKGRPVNPDGYERYLELKSAKYLEPETEGEPGAIRLAFVVSEDVPPQAKVTFSLLQYDLPVAQMNYVLKKAKSTDIALRWRLKEKLARGKYFLRTHLEPKNQSRSVQRALKKNTKRFPLKVAPWPWLYLEKPIEVVGGDGSPCEIYTAFMDRLVDNLDPFLEKMDRAMAAEEFVNGGSLDVPAFTAYVVEWRKKQGELQKEIKLFPEKNMVVFQQARQEYDRLVNLSGMVSKYAVIFQKGVTDHYKVEEIKPTSHKWFRKVRGPVDYDSLARNYDLVRQGLECPDPEDDGDGEGDGEPDSSEKKKPEKNKNPKKTEKKNAKRAKTGE
jgi:hypothetical protein